MNVYEVNGRTLAVIDGELYERLSSHTPPMPNVTPSRRGRKPGSGTKPNLNKAIVAFSERKKRKFLGPEAEEVIRAEIATGLGIAEVCKKYEISVSTYYRLKGESQSKLVVEG